jgi:hypothetical protein
VIVARARRVVRRRPEHSIQCEQVVVIDPHQVGSRHPYSLGQAMQVQQPDVTFAALYRTDIRAVKAGCVGQFLLREPPRLARKAKSLTEPDESGVAALGGRRHVSRLYGRTL